MPATSKAPTLRAYSSNQRVTNGGECACGVSLWVDHEPEVFLAKTMTKKVYEESCAAPCLLCGSVNQLQVWGQREREREEHSEREREGGREQAEAELEA